MKNIYENLNIILQKIILTAYDWMLRGDLTAVAMLFGQQRDLQSLNVL